MRYPELSSATRPPHPGISWSPVRLGIVHQRWLYPPPAARSPGPYQATRPTPRSGRLLFPSARDRLPVVTVQTSTFVFAILTVLAEIFVVAVAALWVIARWSHSAASALDRSITFIAPSALWYAWVVALVTMLGSLYYSLIIGFEPCTLCWYQRIALFPTAVILLVAAIRQDRDIWRYVVPLLLIGIAISIYHYQLEWFPHQKSLACSIDTPCSAIWFREFGYITLAAMALSSAAAQITLVLIARRAADPYPQNSSSAYGSHA